MRSFIGAVVFILAFFLGGCGLVSAFGVFCVPGIIEKILLGAGGVATMAFSFVVMDWATEP